MKRKHEDTHEASEPSFTSLGLDPRLLKAIAAQKFQTPTLVQQQAIPLALDGQDVLAKAKTGSGKTLCYVSVVLQGVLRRKKVGSTPGVSWGNQMLTL